MLPTALPAEILPEQPELFSHIRAVIRLVDPLLTAFFDGFHVDSPAIYDPELGLAHTAKLKGTPKNHKEVFRRATRMLCYFVKQGPPISPTFPFYSNGGTAQE
jgi:hypothetical protein